MPEEIIEGGPVIAQRDGKPATFSVPDHKLVLTFDDGPDPEWTPKVLDVLAEHDAHGVFFVTGTMASRHPDLVKRMVDELIAGLRPGTPDNAPVLGPGALEGLQWATGHFRHGVLLTPITSQVVAATLAGEPLPEHAVRFGAERFAEMAVRA